MFIGFPPLAGPGDASHAGSTCSPFERSQLGSNDNKVLTTLELAHARDFWTHFPRETRAAPELDLDTPALMMVFDGQVTVGAAYQPSATDNNAATTPQFGPIVLQDVVCVYLPPSDMYPQGEPLVYYNVNLDGFEP